MCSVCDDNFVLLDLKFWMKENWAIILGFLITV